MEKYICFFMLCEKIKFLKKKNCLQFITLHLYINKILDCYNCKSI